jgi:hypothetical protein
MFEERPVLGYLSEEQYASFRGVSLRSIRNERARRAGPPFIRVGRKVYYPVAAVRNWMASRQLQGSKD